MIAAPRFGASFGAEWVAVCTALCFRDPVRAALCLWLNWHSGILADRPSMRAPGANGVCFNWVCEGLGRLLTDRVAKGRFHEKNTIPGGCNGTEFFR